MKIENIEIEDVTYKYTMIEYIKMIWNTPLLRRGHKYKLIKMEAKFRLLKWSLKVW